MEPLRFVRGISAPPPIAVGPFGVGAGGVHHPPQVSTAAHAGRPSPGQLSAGPLDNRRPYMFLGPLRRLWPGNGDAIREEKKSQEGHVASLEAPPSTSEEEEREEREKANWMPRGLWARSNEEKANIDEGHVVEPEASTSNMSDEKESEEKEGHRKTNWVLNILRVRSETADRTADIKSGYGKGETVDEEVDEDETVGCTVDYDEEEIEDGKVFDRNSFGKLLKKVSLDQMRVYAKVSYLSNLAYNIKRIKPQNLLEYHKLRFVTSSLETKELNLQTVGNSELKPHRPEESKPKIPQPEINLSFAYDVAASAASYLQSTAKGILPFGSNKAHRGINRKTGEKEGMPTGILDEASFVATTSSVTSVVAAKEERKEEIAKDLNSSTNSTCEWFVCDDDQSSTRYFVIQGSESMASWQANLLFEPVKFEGLDVLVHRGIYEAAKGMYLQMLPLVTSHLNSRGSNAKFQFTGHSLGGSLALLINLMLLIRGVAPASALLPVVTFGAPAVMCGGDYLLRKLGLSMDHVHGIAMHRDIVPRAFSCNYPDNVAQILKAVNGNFRNHRCLVNKKLLYEPMGKLVILQPDETFSPSHHLLPPGCGLHFLFQSDQPKSLLKSAQTAFLNSPHPLEILSDRSSYGPGGTIHRDHDMNSYMKSVRSVIRQELKLRRKMKRQQRQYVWWPLVVPHGMDPSIIMGSPDAWTSHTIDDQERFNFSGIFRGGRETMKRIKRLVVLRNIHLLVIVFLLPARLLIMGPISHVRLP